MRLARNEKHISMRGHLKFQPSAVRKRDQPGRPAVRILGERARCERKRKRDEGDNEPGEYLTAVSEEPFTIQLCFHEFVMICGAAVEIKY